VRTPTRSRSVAGAVAVALVGAGLVPAARAAAPPNSVVAWNAIAQGAAITSGKQAPSEATITIAYVQAAVYDATVAIDGSGRPYGPWQRPRRHASVDAAVATAAHDMLVHLLPAQATTLDVDYATALAAIPDGRAKDSGTAVGHLAAAGIIAARQGDGYQTDIGFTTPPPTPGVWQLPVGQTPLTPWISKMRPFLLASPEQFRPGPPPALTSRAWARELNEVKAVGGATSTVRTPDQTMIARFWTSQAAQQWNTALGQLISNRGFDADQAARLFATVDLISADAAIGCFDAKYHYLFWRPQFAVPLANTDGNPATTADPTWTPLVATPTHPEYPSAHGCVSTAAADALSAFLGTRRIEIDMPSTVAGTDPSRHFDTVDEMITEIRNARVWGGLHYRGSTLVGSRLGDQVARWDLFHGPFRTAGRRVRP
jgi:PAP2 superfamily